MATQSQIIRRLESRLKKKQRKVDKKKAKAAKAAKIVALRKKLEGMK